MVVATLAVEWEWAWVVATSAAVDSVAAVLAVVTWVEAVWEEWVATAVSASFVLFINSYTATF